MRAIIEQELTEMGDGLGEEFMGNQKPSVIPKCLAQVSEANAG